MRHIDGILNYVTRSQTLLLLLLLNLRGTGRIWMEFCVLTDPSWPPARPHSLRHKEQPFQISPPHIHRHALTADHSRCLWSWSGISVPKGAWAKVPLFFLENYSVNVGHSYKPRFTLPLSPSTAQTTHVPLFGYSDTRKASGKTSSEHSWCVIIFPYFPWKMCINTHILAS